MLHGKLPLTKWLRSYGDVVYTYDYRPNSTERARRGYLVGISLAPIQGFKVYYPDTQHVSVVHDANFADDVLPTNTVSTNTLSTSDSNNTDLPSGTNDNSMTIDETEHRLRNTTDGNTQVRRPSEQASNPASTTTSTDERSSDLQRQTQNTENTIPEHTRITTVQESDQPTDETREQNLETDNSDENPEFATPPTSPNATSPRGNSPDHITNEPDQRVPASDVTSPVRSPVEGAESEEHPDQGGVNQEADLETEPNDTTDDPNEAEAQETENTEIITMANDQMVGMEELNQPRRSARIREREDNRRSQDVTPKAKFIIGCVNPVQEESQSTPSTKLTHRIQSETRKAFEDATVVVDFNKNSNYAPTTLTDLSALLTGTKTELKDWFKTGKKIGVLDLCSGSKSFTRTVENAGVAQLFDVITVDSKADTNPTVQMTVQELCACIDRNTIPKKIADANISIIWCSPPCTFFSAANTRTTRSKKKKFLAESDEIVRSCIRIIRHFNPLIWVIENPDTGSNRLTKRNIVQEHMPGHHEHTTTYCWYGRDDRKATSIFSNIPDLQLKDCRRENETCLVKEIKGHHNRTAQAGTSITADGTVVRGTSQKEAQRVPEQLIREILQCGLRMIKDQLWNRTDENTQTKLHAFAVNKLSSNEQLGRRVRKLSEIPQSELQEAKLKEINGLIDRSVFNIVTEKEVKTSAPSLQYVWVYKVREDDTVKARLCVGGHKQIKGKNYWEISSPTPRSTTTKLALAIAAQNGWDVNTADVSQAYVAASLGVLMYMKPPPEIALTGILKHGQTIENTRLELKKSLYGAKQSGRNWHEEVSCTLVHKSHYTQSQKDPCLFFRLDWSTGKPTEIIVIYVDDFLFLGSRSRFEDFMTSMKRYYSITASPQSEFEVHVWNGLEISKHNDGRISITQIAKVREMAREYQKTLDEIFPKKTKIDHPESKEDLFDPRDAVDPKSMTKEEADTLRLYQSMTGSALYVASYTRFDIAYALSKAARLMHCASKKHLRGIARIIKYLIQHEDFKLTYDGTQCTPDGQLRLFTFVDSDYAKEPFNKLEEDNLGRRSTSAVVIMACNCTIFWKAKLQPRVAASTGEAEFRALWIAVKESLFCIHLLREIGYDTYEEPLVPIFCDANVGIAHAKRDGLAWLEGTKQYEVELSCVYQHVQEGTLVPIKIETEENPADLLSKPNVGSDERCTSFRRRIAGQPMKQSFSTWVKERITKHFTGSSVMQDRFISLEGLLKKYGLSS